jgi:hypothetical protein
VKNIKCMGIKDEYLSTADELFYEGAGGPWVPIWVENSFERYGYERKDEMGFFSRIGFNLFWKLRGEVGKTGSWSWEY